MDKEIYDSYLDFKYIKTKLTSGLTLIFVPAKRATGAAMLSVNYGSCDGREDKSGFPMGTAHFLEHKMFECPDGHDVTEDLSSLGIAANAFTTFDKTAYYFSAVSDFYEGLKHLISFVYTPAFKRAAVEREKGIIGEEIRAGQDSADSRIFYLLLSLLYPDHPISLEIAGTLDSISEITEKSLLSAYNTYYTPDNMTLAICGDYDIERIKAIVNRELGRSFKKAPNTEDIFDTSMVEEDKRRGSYEMSIARHQLMIGYKDDIKGLSKREALKRQTAFFLLDNILFRESSDLYNYLLDSNIADDIYSSYLFARGAAFHYFGAEADDPEKVYSLYLDAVERAKGEGIKEEDFLRAKRTLISSYIRSLADSEEVVSNAVELSHLSLDFSDYGEILREITVDDINSLASLLCDEKRTAMYVIKRKEEL